MRKSWQHILCSLVVVLLAAGLLSAANNSWNFPVPKLGGLTTGGLIYAQSQNALGNIDAVAVGRVLVSAGTSTMPAWSQAVKLAANTETADAYAGTDGVRLFASLVAGKPVLYIRFATGLPRPIATSFN